MSTRSPWVPIAFSTLALGMLPYAAWLSPVPGLAEWLTMAGLGLAGALSLVAARAKGHRYQLVLACALLAGMLAFTVASAAGTKLFGVDPYHDTRYASFLSALIGLTLVALWRQHIVGRWLALALAAAGIASAGLNLGSWYAFESIDTWAMAVHIAGALLIVANLLGPQLAERFADGARPLWTSREPVLRTLRWALVAQFVAIPMLLVYAWMQPIVPNTSSWAMGLALGLGVSAFLAVQHRVIGALGLVLGGMCLLIFTAKIVSAAYEIGAAHGSVSNYYAIFWTPAGLAATLSGIRLMRPIARLLRG